MEQKVGTIPVFQTPCGHNPEQKAGMIHVPNPDNLLAYKVPRGDDLEHNAGTIHSGTPSWGEDSDGAMRGLETDHVISEPMRGLKININGRGHR